METGCVVWRHGHDEELPIPPCDGWRAADGETGRCQSTTQYGCTHKLVQCELQAGHAGFCQYTELDGRWTHHWPTKAADDPLAKDAAELQALIDREEGMLQAVIDREMTAAARKRQKGGDAGRCESTTTLLLSDRTVRCSLPAGHDGRHECSDERVGVVHYWPAEGAQDEKGGGAGAGGDGAQSLDGRTHVTKPASENGSGAGDVPLGVEECLRMLRALAMETRGSIGSFDQAAQEAAATYLRCEREVDAWLGRKRGREDNDETE